MKSVTDLAQSKKLIELGIDVDTADMWYLPKGDSYELVTTPSPTRGILPAWSLTALLGVLPEGIIENYYAPNLQKENGKYSIAYGNDELLCIADNPVDACYEMILKLHELNLL
jgi:hypothetical protein